MAGRRAARPSDPADVAVRVTTARVACATCGPIIVPFDDVELVTAGAAIWYQFGCRTCGRANTVSTAPYATDLLVMSGIRIRNVATPREVREYRSHRAWTLAEIDALLAAFDRLDPHEPEHDAEPTPDGSGLGPPLSDGAVPTSGPDQDRIDRGPAEP